MTPFPHSPVSPTIINRRQLDAVVENIVQLRLERIELLCAQEQEIAAVRQKYRAPLAEVERYLLLETSWAETWARDNPAAFAEKRSLDGPHATIGFRTTPPQVERASRKWTWTAAALKLAETAWGRRYLRTPAPEVNKEAILADRATLSAEELRQAGLKILQGERFYIEPHGQADVSVDSDPDLEAAA